MNNNKCVLVRNEEIDKTLATAPTQGKKLLEPLKSFAATNKLPFNILEDKEVLDNEAEVHKHVAVAKRILSESESGS